jgi:asparagine synthase (glutamine-hydrolysing)
MSDVPIGFFLSGGIDSSLTTAIAAEGSSAPIETFTLTYADRSATPGKHADRSWARYVADRYGTRHHEEVVEIHDFPGQLRRILRAFDEPFAGVVSSYFLSRLIAQHVKVAISGDGADELFGSYLSHRLAQPLASYSQYAQTGDRSVLRPFEDRPEYLAGLLAHDGATGGAPRDWVWRARLQVFDEAEKRALYSPDLAAALDGASTTDLVRRTFDELTAVDPLNRVLEAELRTIFPDQVLAYGDRLSMAHSLEVRAPYLDTDVVSFVAALPGTAKIRCGQTKFLLKRAALRYFPEEMVHRPKEGFLMPVTDWLTTDLQPYVRETLSPDRLARHGLFRPDAVQTLVDTLLRDGSDYHDGNRVFALLVFQEWYDLYFS